MHINPDHFLETPAGRITTPERNALAWRQSFAALDEALRARSARTVVYLMIGCQASGKSTWARAKHVQDPDAICFDAILVQQSERRPILEAAARRGVPAVAVWFRTPLERCLARNAARPADEVVDEQGLRNVFAALEPPQPGEGFTQVIEVDPDAPHDGLAVFGEREAGTRYVVRPSAYAIIEDAARRVAIVRTGAGVFLPGGGIEAGETPEQAIHREVREECGFRVRIGERLPGAIEFVHSRAERAHFEKVCTFFTVTIEGEPAPATEADHEVLWVTHAEALRLLGHLSHRWAVSGALSND